MTAAIRGATTVESNEKEQIYEAAAEMMKEIIEANNIDKNDIVSIIKNNKLNFIKYIISNVLAIVCT